ncbi:MAG TPA: imidazole glycerol phosphate synthase subunit HisF [Alphaproteobacteria bacterium]|nr:imidazole glycerol phosphate synthase subunit HisF [Alphaproteobacteria bacterium]
MITKRIIPCLDVKDGQTVKGVNFENLRYAGDAAELAKRYSEQGADELVLLDITATNDGRKTMLDVVERVAENVFIPFAVGGGIRTLDDMRDLLLAGADKVSVNSAAVENPDLIEQAAGKFGSQCVTVAIDVKKYDGEYYVVTRAGKHKTALKALEWAKTVGNLGAGEILLTSMDADGTQQGFDLPITAAISQSVRIPVIASGGAGANPQHFVDVFEKGFADAALAASIFHFGTLPVPVLKQSLKNHGVNVRLV